MNNNILVDIQHLLADALSSIGVLGWVIIGLVLFILCQAIWRSTQEKKGPETPPEDHLTEWLKDH